MLMVDSPFWVRNGAGSNPVSLTNYYDKVAEWSKATDCKSVPYHGS